MIAVLSYSLGNKILVLKNMLLQSGIDVSKRPWGELIFDNLGIFSNNSINVIVLFIH